MVIHFNVTKKWAQDTERMKYHDMEQFIVFGNPTFICKP